LQTVKNKLMETSPSPGRPDEEILELLKITLENNDFEFNGDYYLQTCGTAMGKKYAPSLANIYLLHFDEKARNGFQFRPDNYGRYLDDIFFTWGGSAQSLKEFENFLSNIIPGIKITLEYHDTHINFLDTTIYKLPLTQTPDHCLLQTKIFFKTTDTHQLLHVASHHPSHTTKGILKSQLIRFKKISSCKNDYDSTCKILFKHLKNRGYSWSLMRKQQKDIWFNYQLTNEIVTNSQPNTIIPIVNENNKISNTLSREFKNILRNDPLFENYKLITASKNPKNLHKYLVRAKL
jgi:hypothetical protein